MKRIKTWVTKSIQNRWPDRNVVSNYTDDSSSKWYRHIQISILGHKDKIEGLHYEFNESEVMFHFERDYTYRPFQKSHGYTFPIEPYCVKLFENRWYVLAHNVHYNDMRVYGLDRVEEATIADITFKLPKDFSASEFFSAAYGIVINHDTAPETIVLRANKEHKPYMKSLPLHHSQRLIADCDDYADFELRLTPTYDFIMKLLQASSMIEVLKPAELRKTMKNWISEMYELYRND